MVPRWRKDLFNGEIKTSAKRKTMGCYSPKNPELDQTLLEWFSEQRNPSNFSVLRRNYNAIPSASADFCQIMLQIVYSTVGTAASDRPQLLGLSRMYFQFSVKQAIFLYFFAEILGFKPSPPILLKFDRFSVHIGAKSLGLQVHKYGMFNCQTENRRYKAAQRQFFCLFKMFPFFVLLRIMKSSHDYCIELKPCFSHNRSISPSILSQLLSLLLQLLRQQ